MPSRTTLLIFALAIVCAVATAAAWLLRDRPSTSFEAAQPDSRDHGRSTRPNHAGTDSTEARDDELSRTTVADSDLAPQPDADLEDPSADDDSYQDLSGRQPNLERVRGLTGERIVADWPNGARCFEAEQKLAPDGEWRLDGSWKAWYPNGQIEELGSYRADREHGFWRWWYEDGRPMAEGSFEDGVRNGRWRFTHRNGSPLSVGDYTAGKRSGRWTFWYDFGEIDEDHSGVYRDGVRVED